MSYYGIWDGSLDRDFHSFILKSSKLAGTKEKKKEEDRIMDTQFELVYLKHLFILYPHHIFIRNIAGMYNYLSSKGEKDGKSIDGKSNSQ